MGSVTDAVAALAERAAAKQALGSQAHAGAFSRPAQAEGQEMYRNHYAQLGIDFTVERVSFPDTQTLDPRVVRIAPGATNELHRHAHESLFVVLSGEGVVRVGEHQRAVFTGDLAFVPRWILHQTSNTSASEELVLLAVTDFGFTKAVLGDYTKKTRRKRSA